jgi:hypothetical protein
MSDPEWVIEERHGTSVAEDVRRSTQETTYRDLVNLSDNELARRFDLLLSAGYHELTIDHYRDEIQRRESRSRVSASSG